MAYKTAETMQKCVTLADYKTNNMYRPCYSGALPLLRLGIRVKVWVYDKCIRCKNAVVNGNGLRTLPG